MSKNKFQRLLQDAIKEKVFPGCVFGVVTREGQRLVLPLGRMTYQDDAPKMFEDSIFDVASITKSIPTAALALTLIDQGGLSLEDRLIKYLPEFKNSDRELVKIKHLLTHTVDYGLWLSNYKDRSPEQILDLLFTTDFKNHPGTSFVYSNAAVILLGIAVDRVFGSDLETISQKYFFKSLRMERTTFKPLEKFKKEEIVPTEIDDWRGGEVRGEVHDETAWKLRQKMIVGSAGLFSTVPDLLNFIEMLLNEGEIGGQKYFSKKIVKAMHTNQISKLGNSIGLGFDLNQQQTMGDYRTEETFGKTGFTGCNFLLDIKKGVGYVLLSNHRYPRRKEGSLKINKLRGKLLKIAFEEKNK